MNSLLTSVLLISFLNSPDIAKIQTDISAIPVGDRIALWAEEFVGTPYDPDPLGEYVSRSVIVADERVDCMYHAFRSVELALSNTPERAVEIALEKRFFTKGRLDRDGRVLNYDDRYQYGIDMIDGGKWGEDVTPLISETVQIEGERGREKVTIVSREAAIRAVEDKNGVFRSGDIVFFIKSPEKRIVGEIVGHIGILKADNTDIYLIHASGSKMKGGIVKKIPFIEYLREMPFIGIKISRF